MTQKTNGENPNGAPLFEAANKLRGSVESAEYKHLVLGLIFLKYISDSFDLRRAELEAELSDPASSDYVADAGERAEILDDRDEYVAANAFWVPDGARWAQLLAPASQPDIARRIDDALEAIEVENPRLRNVLPRVYARAPLSGELMGSLVQTIAKIGFGEGTQQARDVLGRTYEYFIKEFARAEGHRGGEFFTPGPVARLLVEMLEPYKGRVLDPACGSCGLFVQSGRFVEAHGGDPDQISIYGQERNQATWRIGQMNLAIHGLGGEVRYTENGSLLDDAYPSLKADFVMANPPFNQKEWSTPAVLDDARWVHGVPPTGNANYAWIQHFLHHLAPDGRAGFVMANGSLTTMTSGEGAIRENLIRADVVDCVVALPGQLFYTTGIPVCLWLLDRDKASSGERDRRGESLFIDARQLGSKISRTQIELTDALDRAPSGSRYLAYHCAPRLRSTRNTWPLGSPGHVPRNARSRFSGAFLEPTPGLEPGTPSGPAWSGRGRSRSGYFTMRPAEAWLREVLERARSVTLSRLVRTGVTFAEAAEEWLRYVEHDRERRPSTVAGYRVLVRSQLLPTFGELAIVSITTPTIERWLAGVERSTGTRVRRACSCTASSRAPESSTLTVNPAAEVEKPSIGRSGDIAVFSPEEVMALVRAAASEQDAAIYLTAAFTGLRRGELLALRWRDVDFAGQVIRVRASYAEGHLTTPKSGKVRSVPMAPEVAEALARLAQRDRCGGVFGGHGDSFGTS